LYCAFNSSQLINYPTNIKAGVDRLLDRRMGADIRCLAVAEPSLSKVERDKFSSVCKLYMTLAFGLLESAGNCG
jgi:hypothetical protein